MKKPEGMQDMRMCDVCQRLTVTGIEVTAGLNYSDLSTLLSVRIKVLLFVVTVQ